MLKTYGAYQAGLGGMAAINVAAADHAAGCDVRAPTDGDVGTQCKTNVGV